MQVVESSLVEYYESCRSDLLNQGAHVLIFALVRDADAPSFYDDLKRYWDSINDATGRHVVFAVAGSRAAQEIGRQPRAGFSISGGCPRRRGARERPVMLRPSRGP
jgi:hypothetical protein